MVKSIGVVSVVEQLLPCLVECFNCDDVIHPDLYEPYAMALFQGLDSIIEFLTIFLKVENKDDD